MNISFENGGECGKYAYNWMTKVDKDGTKTLIVTWRKDTTPEGVSKFVQVYEREHNARLEFVDSARFRQSVWLIHAA